MTSGKPQVVCIGLAAWDSIALVRRHPASDERTEAVQLTRAGGGPAATAAVTLARLGVPVAFVGAVGDDPAGRSILGALADGGVQVDRLRMVPGAQSPESIILVDESDGARAIAAYAGTAGGPSVDRDVERLCRGARWVHLDHIGEPATRVLRRLLGREGDGIGPRWSLDGGNHIDGLGLAGLDLYGPTCATLLARSASPSLDGALQAAIDEGCGAVVATRGRHGARALVSGERPFSIAGFTLPVVSTLGAGDVFHGALLAGLLDGRDLAEAIGRANLAAALSTAALDGRSAIPTRRELDLAWVAQRSEAGTSHEAATVSGSP